MNFGVVLICKQANSQINTSKFSPAAQFYWHFTTEFVQNVGLQHRFHSKLVYKTNKLTKSVNVRPIRKRLTKYSLDWTLNYLAEVWTLIFGGKKPWFRFCWTLPPGGRALPKYFLSESAGAKSKGGGSPHPQTARYAPRGCIGGFTINCKETFRRENVLLSSIVVGPESDVVLCNEYIPTGIKRSLLLQRHFLQNSCKTAKVAICFGLW